MGVAVNFTEFFILLLEYCLGENSCISIIGQTRQPECVTK